MGTAKQKYIITLKKPVKYNVILKKPNPKPTTGIYASRTKGAKGLEGITRISTKKIG